jgi:GNAT superfamily N-acetyltransferase
VPFAVTALARQHDRGAFSCGAPALDDYLRRQAGQDVRRRVAACFVATDSAGRVAAYYTLAAASLPLTALPDGIVRRLPRYPAVPAARLGRLAVDQACQGQGLGAAMLADALDRTARSDIAAAAMVVDAKDHAAARFCAHHGFIALDDQPSVLFLPLATAQGAPRGDDSAGSPYSAGLAAGEAGDSGISQATSLCWAATPWSKVANLASWRRAN